MSILLFLIFKLNREYSFHDFIELISIKDKSIPPINKEALLHAFFTFKRTFPDYNSDLFKISIQKIRKNSSTTKQFYNLESRTNTVYIELIKYPSLKRTFTESSTISEKIFILRKNIHTRAIIIKHLS